MATNPNPYDPPSADLTSEPIRKRKPPGIWWKIYFILTSLAGLGGYLFMFLRLELSGFKYVEQIFGFVLVLISSVGAGGYVFGKKILRPNTWRYIFYVYVFYAVVSTGLAVYRTPSDMKSVYYILAAVSAFLGFLFALPSYIALYRYGSANEYPWRDEKV